MIALLLAAQLSAEIVRGMPADVAPPSKAPAVRLLLGNGLARILPTGPCPGAGRTEASMARPSALYRKGDRAARMLSGWSDYPDPRGCLVEAQR